MMGGSGLTTENTEAAFADTEKGCGKETFGKTNRLNVKHSLQPCDRVEHIFATNPNALQA